MPSLLQNLLTIKSGMPSNNIYNRQRHATSRLILEKKIYSDWNVGQVNLHNYGFTFPLLFQTFYRALISMPALLTQFS